MVANKVLGHHRGGKGKVMSEHTEHAAGTPSWVDIGTDVEAAKGFYGQIFGWEALSAGPRGDRRIRVLHQGRKDGRRLRTPAEPRAARLGGLRGD